MNEPLRAFSASPTVEKDVITIILNLISEIKLERKAEVGTGDMRRSESLENEKM